ncbi:MAG: hypothetical protein ACOCZK_02290 [Planctomycetota bacterium]
MSKDSTQSGGESGGGKMPASSHSFAQQSIVILLIVAVGVLFGMQPILGLLTEKKRTVLGDIDEKDVRRFATTCRQLQQAINPRGYGPPYFVVSRQAEDEMRQYAQRLQMADIAEDEGLMPKGETLEQLVDEFLEREMQAGPEQSASTYGQLLLEDGSVDRSRVERYVAVDAAISALQARYVVTPVLPLNMAENIAGFGAPLNRLLDQPMSQQLGQLADRVGVYEVSVPVTEAMIAAEREAVSDDAVADAYEDLRETHFRIPAAREVTLAVADAETIVKAVSVDQEAITDYYEENTQDPEDPGDPALVNPAWQQAQREREAAEQAANAEDGAEEEEEEEAADEAEEEEADLPPAFLPLPEVEEHIRETLAQQYARSLVSPLANAMLDELRRAKVEPADLPRDALLEILGQVELSAEASSHLDQAVGLELISGVMIRNEPGERSFTIEHAGRDFGAVQKSSVGLFAVGVEPGKVHVIKQTSREGVAMLMRVDAVIEEDYRKVDEVREQLVDYVAGRRAYGTLLEEMRALAQRATELGRDGLEQLFVENPELAERWGVELAGGSEDEDEGETGEKGLEVQAQTWDTTYQLPGEEPDEPGDDEPIYALALATADHPCRVVMGAAPQEVGADEAGKLVPRLRLIQARDYQPASIPPFIKRPNVLRYFREGMVVRALANTFYTELQNRGNE